MIKEIVIMTDRKVIEDLNVTWVDESMTEEMDDTEVCWEIYCQEMSFYRSSVVE
jgi:hypothetical protein